MIKQFSAGDITIRPFSTFKHWTMQSFNSSSVNEYGDNTYYNGKVEINRGVKLSGYFYPSSSQYYIASKEPVNPSGKYARNVYGITDAMFYKNSREFNKSFGVEKYNQNQSTGRHEVREIHGQIVTANLKHNVWGDKLIPNTINIIDTSNIHQVYNISDDGYTNLYASGSHFPEYQLVSAPKSFVPTPYWVTSSGQFFVTFGNGTTQNIDVVNAKQYMSMGVPVTYIPPSSGSWSYDDSSARNFFEPKNEHFGESISCWAKYVAVGSSMDQYSLSSKRNGYVAIFKLDEGSGKHRLINEINFPFTQSQDGVTNFNDSFGHSVSLRDNFLAVGSPTGSACSTSSYNGYVCVYEKNKGGSDNWGIVSMIKGDSNGDKFGHSVSLDNDILVVGAPSVSGSRGSVYIFRKKRFMDENESCQSIPTGSNWMQVVTVDDFCKELTTSSYITSQSYTPTFVSGNYAWTHEAILTASLSSVGDRFGWAVSVDSNRLVVGTNKSGKGYAAVFTCSYYSASLYACPTASWVQTQLFAANTSSGDLNANSPEYSVDVSFNITDDKFGTSVSISGPNVVIGCLHDKAYRPYNGYTGSALILGAAYFYQYTYSQDCNGLRYKLITKTFGDRTDQLNNNFANAVSIDGATAAVTSLPNNLNKSVD
jgi:hypothetical protein